MEKWKNVKRIFELCTLVVLTRPGYDERSLYKQKDYIEEKYNGKIVILELEGMDISSTEIRGLVKEGKNISKLVASEVFKLIKNNDLYMGD